MKMLTPEQLFRELVEHVAESLDAAGGGSDVDRKWLLQCFPAYASFLHWQWRARTPESEPAPRPVIRVHASRAAK